MIVIVAPTPIFMSDNIYTYIWLYIYIYPSGYKDFSLKIQKF